MTEEPADAAGLVAEMVVEINHVYIKKKADENSSSNKMTIDYSLSSNTLSIKQAMLERERRLKVGQTIIHLYRLAPLPLLLCLSTHNCWRAVVFAHTDTISTILEPLKEVDNSSVAPVTQIRKPETRRCVGGCNWREGGEREGFYPPPSPPNPQPHF